MQKKTLKIFPCVTKGWQSNKNEELGFGEDYEEKDITDEDAELSEMKEDQIN